MEENQPDRPALTTEIEITTEMIDAGAAVIGVLNLRFGLKEYWAEQVYRAMASKAPREPSASHRSLA